MSIRLPRIAIKTVPITCRLDADLHADVEASAAAYETQYGDTMPLALLITTMVWEYLQKDLSFMRQRRQAESAPLTHATPNSTTRQSPG